MINTNVKQIRARNRKREDNIRKTTLFKETASNSLKNVLEYDSMTMKANGEYLGALSQANKLEYDILMENMKIAETAEERQAIRTRMAEIKKEDYEKDTENKSFYERQQANYKNYNIQVLGSLAVVAGLVRFRKPLMDFGKMLITKH